METDPLPETLLAALLESRPPGSRVLLTDEVERHQTSRGGKYVELLVPEVQIYCESATCGGQRVFAPISQSAELNVYAVPRWEHLQYSCRNCEGSSKIYSVSVKMVASQRIEAFKMGEFPAFGPSVPSRVISLVGPERDHLLKGRRSENQGLGIAAFAYYRRVVEAQWQRLVDEIVRVARATGSPADTIAILESARNETQFSRAVESIKIALPDTLKVQGHNPLTLLYRALSDGLHDRTDETCLGLAASIRLILYDLAERSAQALKDEHELREAVARLLDLPGS